MSVTKIGKITDQNIRNLLQNEDAQIHTEQVTVNHSFENLSEFAEIFSEAIHQFIDYNFRENTWENLQNFVYYYPFLISSDNESFLKTKLSEKNQIIINTIYNLNSYELFNEEYKFAINPNYYRLQSTLDTLYFQNDILKINNTVSDHQNTTQHNKFFLGEILYALGFFQADYEELIELLRKNSIIGKSWIPIKKKKYDYDPVPKWINIDISNIEEKNYGNIAEWILMGIFYFLICFGLYKLYIWKDIYLYAFIIFEVLSYILFNKRLNTGFENESKTQNDNSFRRKMKKISFKIFLLQLYIIMLSISLLVIMGIAVLTIVTKVFPVLIIGILIYRYIKRKK